MEAFSATATPGVYALKKCQDYFMSGNRPAGLRVVYLDRTGRERDYYIIVNLKLVVAEESTMTIDDFGNVTVATPQGFCRETDIRPAGVYTLKECRVPDAPGGEITPMRLMYLDQEGRERKTTIFIHYSKVAEGEENSIAVDEGGGITRVTLRESFCKETDFRKKG
jgi:3,4-dihydroxy-2-butanone 4-phosphate synthase